MTLLAIETSCDETAVAVLRDRELLASEVASQIAEHEKFGGVVPEVAARNHLVQLPRVLERALASAEIKINEIDAFAATSGPGLASSLLVGNSAAKALAIGAGKPFLAINHLEGHLLSPFFPEDRRPCLSRQRAVPAVEPQGQQARPLLAMTGRTPVFPHIALVVSGGHTLLVEVRGVGEYKILGRTLDDAAGEAFDKIAKLLGLGYPGGPEIERHAKSGNSARFDLPRSMLDSRDLNFSFSGLKTAVRYLLPVILSREGGEGSREIRQNIREVPRSAQDDGVINDLSASFQQAVIDILRDKSLRAVRQTGARLLTLSGGVSCNEALRENLGAACEKNGLEFFAAELWLCTDNAAMIAFAAMLRFENGKLSELDGEIDPNLALADYG
jgi:N6-L-threonylcarbamoyladenine synthase